jgi:hypothetical protein
VVRAVFVCQVSRSRWCRVCAGRRWALRRRIAVSAGPQTSRRSERCRSADPPRVGDTANATRSTDARPPVRHFRARTGDDRGTSDRLRAGSSRRRRTISLTLRGLSRGSPRFPDATNARGGASGALKLQAACKRPDSLRRQTEAAQMAAAPKQIGSQPPNSRHAPERRGGVPRFDKLGVTGSSPVPPT